MHIYIYIYIFPFPQCYFRSTVGARDEHAPNFFCPGTECQTYIKTRNINIPTKI